MVFQCWRKPIFPGRHQPSIFGAGELNFRVRDGNGWTLRGNQHQLFCFCRLSRRLHNDTTPFRKLQALFFNFFQKKFFGPEKRWKPALGRIVLRSCSRRGKWSDKTFGQPSRFSANGNTGKGRCRFSVVRNAGRRGDRFLKISGAAAPARATRRWRGHKKNSRPIGRLLLVLAKTYFSGPSPAKYLRAGELNFRVRDGNGWTLAAINTNCFVFAVSLDGLVIIPHCSPNCKPFFQKISRISKIPRYRYF